MTQQRTRTLFEEGVQHFGIELEWVRLYTTAPSLTPTSPQKCALVYTGVDETARQKVADFAAWLFPWLEERRIDTARFVRAGDVERACEQIRLLAGPTEILRELGSWGSLAMLLARNMVGQLATDTDQYAQVYFEGGQELLREILGISANRPAWQPNTGRPARPVFDSLLVLGLPLGDPLRHLLRRLTEIEQMRLLEQVVIGTVDTYRFPFEPLTC